MKTCTRCGLLNPDASGRCECGGQLAEGDSPLLVEGRLAGFWIRLGSDLLDALVLGVIGFVMTLVFRGKLLRLGEHAVILGAPVTLLYMGVLQSHIGGGQTIAKRLLGLRVLRLDGKFLSLDRALVRWGLMGVVSYGSAIAVALAGVLPAFGAQTLAAAMGGAQLAVALGCALLVPFHPLKRGLHDLLTGSIVIRGGGKVPAPMIARLHNPRRDRVIVLVAIALASVAALSGVFVSRKLPVALGPATRVMNEMEQMGFQNPGLVDTKVFIPGGNFHHIIATGYVPTNEDGSPRVANARDRVLELIRKEMPLDGVDSIVVTLRSGINLGIYSSYETWSHMERATPSASGD